MTTTRIDPAQRILWTDRCQCSHVAASHGPTKTRNLEGACLIPLCGCGAFKAVVS